MGNFIKDNAGKISLGFAIVAIIVLIVWFATQFKKSEHAIALFHPSEAKAGFNVLSREHLAGLSDISNERHMINKIVSEMNTPAEHMMVLQQPADPYPQLFSTGMTERQFVDNIMHTVGTLNRENMGDFPLFKPKREINKLRELSLL